MHSKEGCSLRGWLTSQCDGVSCSDRHVWAVVSAASGYEDGQRHQGTQDG